MAQHDHSEHQHGSMNIRAHEKTFHGFLRLVNWSLVVIFVVLVFLALTGA
ncbi:aa3-type cytochrome c oxidase subunit IV [Pseudogemmobacter humi]|uniref:Cytochrome c oxidase subunit 4 n=1 Tax=Pseudogemmobacter humi TaxID=2483812 RepID=A0A3P5X8A6_9RHOB|nr:aa3-type cytochrome c oxidase subunit IV [Pseudogemmobacter humi]VDC23614.1 Cytochrome c oxidase subunit 4 [Pseudogemmobacter humi]